MATLDNQFPTLSDIAKRDDPDGKIGVIVEMLNQTNEVLEDMIFLEGNLPTGHQSAIRTGLPAATWRKYNMGVPRGKSTTAQVTDNCGMLEAYAEVDKALADLNGNTSAFRMSEDRAFLESMNQEMGTRLWYGNDNINPEQFMGFDPRYNDLSAESGDNIIVGDGAASDNYSMWLVVWGPNTIHGVYPKGSQAGFRHRDLGEQTLFDADGNPYQGYRTHYKWDTGLVVRDWRYAVRIANIDASNLTKNAATGSDLVDLMVQAVERIPNLGMGKPAFYCSRDLRTWLRRQIMNKDNVNLSLDDFEGKKVMHFDGIPIRRSDALLNGTEATIS